MQSFETVSFGGKMRNLILMASLTLCIGIILCAQENDQLRVMEYLDNTRLAIVKDSGATL
jgi:hypothetical protein